MKKKLYAILAFFAILSFVGCTSHKAVTASVPGRIVNGKIVLKTPQRAPGQQSALGMACDPIDSVRVAFVGIGGRGEAAVERYTQIEGVKIVALCDTKPDRVDHGQEILANHGLPPAERYVGEEAFKEMCKSPDIDLVYVCTDWLDHVRIALCAMENGHHAAIEVPGALSIKDCWDLVDTSERTRRHCMMLENCCYDFFEMSTLNMAQHGLFGEVYHVEGAYIHYLTEGWNQFETWRLTYNMEHRGDNYPTHGLGPICQVLNIHRGDKMNYLVSMDTPSYDGRATAKRYRGVDECQLGDHTISLIQTEHKKLIEVQHNVCCPRPYTRMHQLTGSDGFANKYPIEQMSIRNMNGHNALPAAQMDSLLQAYKPQWVREMEEKARRVGGHGGMDYLMDYRLVYCLRHGLPLDEDVYDAAEWSAVQELSRISLEHGSMPVEFPDFTRGDWNVTQGFHYAMKK